jgi:hypothetical protein
MMKPDQNNMFIPKVNLDNFWIKTNPRPIRSGVSDDSINRSTTSPDKGNNKISSPASSFFSYGNTFVTSDPS